SPLDGFPGTAGRRTKNRVTHERAAVAVLERRAVGSHDAVAGDRAQEVEVLVGERVAPADHVAGRPPVAVLEHRSEGAAVGDLELVHALEVERERSLRPVQLERVVVYPPAREAR